MTDKAIVEAVARAVDPLAFEGRKDPSTKAENGLIQFDAYWVARIDHAKERAQAAITAYEAAKEATIKKAADELPQGKWTRYLPGPRGTFIPVTQEMYEQMERDCLLSADKSAEQLVHVEEYMYIDEGEAAEEYGV